MVLEVYGIPPSPPTRSVLLTLDLLDKKYELRPVNPLTGETKAAEYLRLNPLHTIPTLKDDALVIRESRAIITYLASMYGEESLYPKQPSIRAKIDEMLYFDIGTFYRAFTDIVMPKIFGKGTQAGPDQYARLNEVLALLNGFVAKTGYVAQTEKMSVADIAILASFSSLKATGIANEQLEKLPELGLWFERVKAAFKDYKKANGEGAEAFGEVYRSKV